MRTISACITSIIFGLGCGGDDGGGGNIALADLGTELGELTCAQLFECCNDAELMEMFEFINPPITNVAECVEFYNAFITGLLTGPAQEAVERGSLIYNGGLAADCLAQVRNLSCEELNGFEEPALATDCENIFEGQLADGESCVTDLECTSAYCSGETLDGEPGTCATKPGDGEPCLDFECADGLHCDNSGGGEGVCAPALADGADCTFDDDCQSGTCEGTCMPAVPECTGA